MSAIRDPATITKTGRQMVTAGGDITYTKAVLYGQDISHLTKEQVEGLTSIGDPLVTVPIGISDKNDDGNGTTVVLEATFQNSNLKADLPYKAVGFFAKKDDGDEKLVLVGVATDGAYLAATSPDGVSTDSLDIKIAVAVGDASNVTAVVDPAGSVTPATLNGAISKATHDLTDKINTKADKTDLDSQIGIVTKSVSDLSDTVKANKDDTDKALATKADKATVESDLATKANQSDLDKTNAEVAKKANTTDVNSQLATKANAKDVTDALALKDDTVDVDKKISNVTNSVNSLSSTVTSNKSATDTALGTKANANDVANSFEEVRNRVKKLEGQQELTAPDFNTLTSTGIYMIENPTNGKNSPSNGNWGTLVVSRGTTGSDSRILQEYYPDSGDLPYFRMSGPGGVWRDWKQLSDQSEINSLRDAVNTKADKTDVAKDIDTVNKSISSMSATITANQKATDTALDTKADKTTVNQELATKANSTDVDDKLAAKADSADVTKQIKTITDLANTKADQTALDATNATVATKANSTDVYTKTDTDKLLDAKADKAAVEQSLSTKANSADVAKDLQGYTTTADLTKLLAGKRDIADSYSRDELDKKFLQLSTDTSGKVSADQIAKLLASKVDKTDLTSQLQAITDSIGTKANSANVTVELAKKDNTADVDAKIKAVTDLANTKANASDVYNKQAIDTAFSQRDTKIGNNTNVINTINEALKSLIPDDTHAPALPAGFDLNNYFVGWRRSVNTTLKNMPFGWLNDTMYFQGTVAGSDGRFELALYIGDGSNTNPKIAYRFYGWGNWKPWVLLADNGDISYLQYQITNATNLANQASQKVDTTLANSFVRKQGMNANGNCVEIKHTGIKQANGGYAFDMWSDDWTASKLQDVIKNQLPSKANTADVNNALNDKANAGDVSALQNKVNVNTPLFREISADSTWEDIFGVTNPNNVLTSLRINPGGSGQLVNDFAAGIGFGGNDTKAVITVDYGSHVARFTAGNGTAPSWSEDVAFKSDINNVNNQINSTDQTVSALQQTIKTLNDTLSSANDTIKTLQDTITEQATTITGLQTQVNNQAQDIAYIKANYIEGKRFAKADESQATAWEKENSQRIAFITDN